MGLGIWMVYESHYNVELSKNEKNISLMLVSGWYTSD